MHNTAQEVRVMHNMSQEVRVMHNTAQEVRVRHNTAQEVRVRHNTAQEVRVMHNTAQEVRVMQTQSNTSNTSITAQTNTAYHKMVQAPKDGAVNSIVTQHEDKMKEYQVMKNCTP